MLKEYRLEHNLTQQQMADMLGIDISCYSRYETNKRNMPIDTMIKFLEIRNNKHDKEFIYMLKSVKRV